MFLLLVVTLDAQADECWLPSPFASFPFTSPTVRFRVPSHSERAIIPRVMEHAQSIKKKGGVGGCVCV